MVPAPGSHSTGQGAQDGCGTEQGGGGQAGLGPCASAWPVPAAGASAGGRALRGLLHPVPPAGRGLQHAEGLLRRPAQPRLPGEPAGAGPQPAGMHRGGAAGGGRPGEQPCVHPPPHPRAGGACVPPSSLLTWPRAGGSLQDMWLIEGALEVHLGEFHVRMKGNRAESRCGSRPGTSAEGGLLVRIRGSPHNFGFPLTRLGA